MKGPFKQMETNSNTHIRLFSLTRCFKNMDFSNKLLRGNIWGKHFKFLGHLMDRSRLPTHFDRKTVIRNEIHRKEICALETKQLGNCLLSGGDYGALIFMTQYQLSVSTTKEVLMKKGNLLPNQPLLRQVLNPVVVLLCQPLLFDTFWRTFTADTKGVNISQRC